jgi:lipopolysaccharide/colanic/teichoic acid biosynthesis glycosyltransferase
MLRRLIDIAGAMILLTLLLPVLLISAFAVWLGAGRPVFFGHERVGRGGQRFRCLKLRTMSVDAESRLEREPSLRKSYVANGYKLPNGKDPRVTTVGRILRRMHIDEIPQLLNVLDGSMALIGPRPIVPEELKHYGTRAPELLTAKPGIIGEWTSRGHKRPSYPERAEIELDYVRNRSAIRDLSIVIRSIPVVLRGQDDG